MSVRLASAAVALGLAACRIGETSHETVESPLQKVSAVKTCAGAFAKPDLAKLTACGDGKGHCYPGAKTSLTGLPACDDGTSCVPDEVLRAGGGKLKACTFFLGNKPGACLSTMVPDIKDHINELKQDVCDEDERCTPCVNPLDGTDTGTCKANGVYENDCTGGTAARLPTCCHGQGLCMVQDSLEDDQKENLSRDICKDERLCVPAAMVNGEPQSCNALGLSGVCLDVCFAKMLGPSAPVMRGGCGATSVCLPCVIGSGQGMPGCD
ncbi:MAG: Tryptophan synthase alpha chain [Labilithrix sp.]|nr:Tryptophan synthase alpha chain [Labilithrix sp.]